MIRVALPYHLRNLAKVGSEVQVPLTGEVTVQAILDSVEACYPMLVGTIRDHSTKQRRPFVRFYACGIDFSMSPDTMLPEKILKGEEPFLVIGAIAGG